MALSSKKALGEKWGIMARFLPIFLHNKKAQK
jgi:hypothetical protein